MHARRFSVWVVVGMCLNWRQEWTFERSVVWNCLEISDRIMLYKKTFYLSRELFSSRRCSMLQPSRPLWTCFAA